MRFREESGARMANSWCRSSLQSEKTGKLLVTALEGEVGFVRGGERFAMGLVRKSKMDERGRAEPELLEPGA
jgi:hypothetical protein